jgi:uncharacterized iron-regulated membrane protein
VTGLPLIFRDEMRAWHEPPPVAPVLEPDVPPARLDVVVEAARRRFPNEVVRFLYWDDAQAHVIRLGLVASQEAETNDRHVVALDDRTGQLLAEAPPDRGVMYVARKLHEELFAGLPGTLLLGAMGFLFVGSLVSGAVIYGPFMRKLAFGTLRADRLGWLDLHNLLGIATVTWALVVGVTGVMNALAEPLFDGWRAQELASALAAYQGQPFPTDPGSPQAAVDATARAFPHRRIVSVVFPSPRGSPRHFLLWTRGRSPITARLFTPVLVDIERGAVSRAAALPWYLRAVEIARPLHFGDYGGLPLKILWAALDIVTIVVLASGLCVWMARRRGHLEARRLDGPGIGSVG